MTNFMTTDTAFKVSPSYKRKLILVTEENNPKNSEVQAAIKNAIEHLEQPVEFKVVDPSKHPNIGKKLGAAMQEQYTVVDQKKVMLDPALVTPAIIFLEDDVVTWQKSGIVKPEVLWAAMTRKPVYNQPGRGVVPINPHL